MIKKATKRVFESNWTVTIFATMIGVFAGIYLNAFVKDRELDNQTKRAFKKIEQEIEFNKEVIEKNYEVNLEIAEIVQFIFSKLNEEGDLIATQDEMAKFRAKYPEVITDIDSTKLDDGYYNYSGSVNFNLSPPSLNTTDIAWVTFKNSQLISTMNFECLYNLEIIYKLQEEINRENATVLKYFLGQLDKGEKGNGFIGQYGVLIELERALLDGYETYYKEKANCN